MSFEYFGQFMAAVNSRVECGRSFITFIVYMTILLDNILLTVIVPILPDYLSQIEQNESSLLATQFQDSAASKNMYMHYVSSVLESSNETVDRNQSAQIDIVSDRINENRLNEENSSIGILLAMKALVQLIATPFVTSIINSFGYRIPTAFGTFILLLTSLMFAVGTNYSMLLIARSMQGIASACVSVCGMSIIAQLYPEEKKRSQVLGVILGSMALGVLLGYPVGGFLYAFIGKSAPFFIIAFFTAFLLLLQLVCLDMQRSKSEILVKEADYSTFLHDAVILKIAGAIFVSTIAMAILEPCLPIWLMATLKPEKWQIGTVFIPDSIGYFISTNFFAILAHKMGQIETAILSLIIVGISSLFIPHATSILSLVIPHFALGIGIGTLDVALVPLLASIVDSKYIRDDDSIVSTNDSLYGAIYAIQQVSVSFAYFLGPLLGGEIAQYIGFKWLMSLIGLTNIAYAIILFVSVFGWICLKNSNEMDATNSSSTIFLRIWPLSNQYRRFYSSMETN